ncbi:MAG: fibronectin type III domain-containing protein [Candidatus Eisenbacteria bacterium]|uniref:Fibronectin type III domain-containing protein n=1 Tax=Eiseniibacteriota bacterium TaxID=2212470 RepID=A0A538U4R3_UNCEI|nr:MAG: fibronectin type III domain-containing protein [Candidatus Eisenbacteria bacterium]
MSGRIPRAALRRSAAIASLIALCSLVDSCDKKTAVVDPNDGLEGIPSASQLVVWRDTPTQDSVFADLGAAGPSPEDTLIATHDIYYAGPGEIRGMIFDYTRADRFEVFRRESGAFRPFKDFLINPSKRFLKGQADVFRFLDVPPPGPSEQYIGRGLVEGVGAADAPKTNLAQAGGGQVAMDLQYTGATGIRPDIRPLDSLLTLEWNAVPGAAGYWVHVYQLTNQGGEEIVFLPAGTTSYHLGDPLPAGGRILTYTTPINGLDYQVRIAAVDANGQLISYTGISGSFGIFRSETTYRKFPLGSVIVHPNRPILPPGEAEPSVLIPTSNPRLTISPTGATQHR